MLVALDRVECEMTQSAQSAQRSRQAHLITTSTAPRLIIVFGPASDASILFETEVLNAEKASI